jgi:hypothetical protein
VRWAGNAFGQAASVGGRRVDRARPKRCPGPPEPRIESAVCVARAFLVGIVSMFRPAAALISDCLGVIVAVTTADGIMPVGQGCLLSRTHLLTALHVIDKVGGLGATVCVEFVSTACTGTVVWHSRPADMALVELRVQRSEDPPGPTLPAYPQVSAEPLELARQVGYMCLLDTTDERTMETYRSPTFLSAWVSREEKPVQQHPIFSLSPCYSTESLSGSPVFYETGDLCGVLIASDVRTSRQPIPGSRHHTEIDFVFPVISAVEPMGTAIRQAAKLP